MYSMMIMIYIWKLLLMREIFSPQKRNLNYVTYWRC